MHSRPFRGIFGQALLLAGLGVDLAPPPRPREPEPAQDQFDAMVAQLRAGGIDPDQLLAQVGGDRAEFMRLGLIELAARDLARSGVYDVFTARQILDDMSRMPDAQRVHLFERLGTFPPSFSKVPVAARREIDLSDKGLVGWTDLATGEQELTGSAAAFRAAGATLSPDIPDDKRLTMRAPVPRSPGRQLRAERERVGEPLRILAAYTGLTVVELGEIERGVRVPTPEQWQALQVALPELGPMETPPTLEEKRPTIPAAVVERALHPAGRCTCGRGGTGDCEWCVMDRRRELREARRARRLGDTSEAVDTAAAQRDLATARQAERSRKHKTHKVRARQKKARGW